MGRSPSPVETAVIERAAPRAVFAELVAAALGEARVRPTPMASAYLVELLASRVSATPAAKAERAAPTLAEALLAARLTRGLLRIQLLRELGDRALFVAGFFGDSLCRSLVDIDYYGEVGRSAYSDVAASLSAHVAEANWTGLYTELSDCFHEFVDVLAEVADRTRAHRSLELLRLYERYLRTGSPRDRRRLIRLGQVPPERRALRFWQ